MRELDKNKVYDLSELTSEERNKLSVILGFNILNYSFLYYGSEKCWYCTDYGNSKIINLRNAKELFYTLENVQVDCRYLTEEQIKEMVDVFEKNGFNLSLDGTTDEHFYLRLAKCGVSVDFFILDDAKTEITYKKFMKLFGNKEKSQEFKNLVEVLSEELTEEAYKETSNKLNYELDFNFITQLAERMAQNKHKYEPYNWQKLDNITELKQALYRHVMEVMKGNYEDDNRLFGHLESIALNAMFINYQLKKTQ